MTEKAAAYPILTVAALALVAGLHIAAGVKENARDAGMKGAHAPDGWLDVCYPADIPDKRAVIAPLPGGERVAIFRDGAKIYGVTNVCKHQMGPLGEGRIIDGCVTCPWHGWQYRPEDGVSPPPFTERISTYDVRLSGLGRVFVSVKPNPPGAKANFITLEAAP